MNKDQILSIIINKEVEGVKPVSMSRKEILNLYEGRLTSKAKIGQSSTILALDNRIVFYVPGAVGLCSGFIVNSLATYGNTLEEVMNWLEEKNIFWRLINQSDNNLNCLLILKSMNIKLLFIYDYNSKNRYLDQVYFCYSDVDFNRLKKAIEL